MNEDRIKDIRKYGKTARGQKELIRYLQGERISLKQTACAKLRTMTALAKSQGRNAGYPREAFLDYLRKRIRFTEGAQ